MALLFEHVYLDLLAVAAGLLAALVWYMNSNFNYWKKRGVHYLKPEPFFGNVRDITLLRTSQGEMIESLYHQLDGHKYGGVYQLRTPALLLRDPDIIKVIMVKDFPHFQDRGIQVDKKNDPLSQHLFSLGGPIWRVLRAKLTPTFTSGKMKMMFHLIEECSQQLKEYLAEPAAKGEIMELKEVLAKFSTDVIGTCAFGIQFNSMSDPDSEFRNNGRKVFEPTFSKAVKRSIIFFLPALSKILHIPTINREVSEFFLKVVKDTVEYREKNNVSRNDFLQLLIQLKNKGHLEDDHEHSKRHNGSQDSKVDGHKPTDNLELSDGLLAAQVFVFFLAGFETSSTTMSFALHELAVNPDVQDRLREEVDATLEACDGMITYEAIQKMEYLDKVVSETLRKYPPVPNLIRECTIPYTIAGTDVKLEKGTKILIPVHALQRDPKYYPDPERFDPERFSEENKAKRHHFVYLPFGEGPRNCIGMRFGLLQTKMGLLTLLSSYEFSVCKDTVIPLKLDPRAAVTASTSGTILKITNRR